jgi:hypothetical protein
LELLEDRLVLSGQGATAPYLALPDQSSAPPPGAFTPAMLRHAYGIDAVSFAGISGTGAGQTIAIIDAGDNPKFVSSTDPSFGSSDLHFFDQQFGLPDPPSFIKLNQEGQQGNYPPANVSGFAGEEALDVEWAHAIAPQANIILIEANTSDLTDLLNGCIGTLDKIPQVSVVSMSFSGAEFSGETSFDSLFTTPAGHQGITFVTGSGDAGAYPSPARPAGYPALSPNVLTAGGTTLSTDSVGNYQGEIGWSGSGGGISTIEPQPSYQNNIVTQSRTMRTSPDIAFDADPETGVAVYDSFDNGSATPWVQIGGTSLACPCWAAIVAIADQARALVGQSSLDGATQTLPRIYQLPESDFHDIVAGNNGFPAGPGYDLVTGRGSPIAQLLIPDLAGVSFANRLRAFHPFRYIVGPNADAQAPSSADTTFSGNLTAVSYFTQPAAGVQYVIVLGPLPAGVTIDPSVPTITTSTGQLAIPLPIVGLPSKVPVRVELILHNPDRLPISSFFEGFPLQLEPLMT